MFPQTSVQVPSPAAGVIEELLVPDGEKVEGGTPLFKLRKGGFKRLMFPKKKNRDTLNKLFQISSQFLFTFSPLRSAGGAKAAEAPKAEAPAAAAPPPPSAAAPPPPPPPSAVGPIPTTMPPVPPVPAHAMDAKPG